VRLAFEMVSGKEHGLESGERVDRGAWFVEFVREAESTAAIKWVLDQIAEGFSKVIDERYSQLFVSKNSKNKMKTKKGTKKAYLQLKQRPRIQQRNACVLPLFPVYSPFFR
jgi:hypothetical protein